MRATTTMRSGRRRTSFKSSFGPRLNRLAVEVFCDASGLHGCPLLVAGASRGFALPGPKAETRKGPPLHRVTRRDASCSRQAAWQAPVAQLDRAPDYESGGQRFESFRARHFRTKLRTLGGPSFWLVTLCSRTLFRPIIWMASALTSIRSMSADR
jgi:hypothetical protein